jgi:hypothetical protein
VGAQGRAVLMLLLRGLNDLSFPQLPDGR